MCRYFLFVLLAASLSACTTSQSVLELSSAQSMCITGKGPGQDAAINPYIEMDSRGVVRNLGTSEIDARIQYEGDIVEIVTLAPNEKQEVDLPLGHELYLDSRGEGKARVTFRKGLKLGDTEQ